MVMFCFAGQYKFYRKHPTNFQSAIKQRHMCSGFNIALLILPESNFYVNSFKFNLKGEISYKAF